MFWLDPWKGGKLFPNCAFARQTDSEQVEVERTDYLGCNPTACSYPHSTDYLHQTDSVPRLTTLTWTDSWPSQLISWPNWVLEQDPWLNWFWVDLSWFWKGPNWFGADPGWPPWFWPPWPKLILTVDPSRFRANPNLSDSEQKGQTILEQTRTDLMVHSSAFSTKIRQTTSEFWVWGIFPESGWLQEAILAAQAGEPSISVSPVELLAGAEIGTWRRMGEFGGLSQTPHASHK